MKNDSKKELENLIDFFTDYEEEVKKFDEKMNYVEPKGNNDENTKNETKNNNLKKEIKKIKTKNNYIKESIDLNKIKTKDLYSNRLIESVLKLNETKKITEGYNEFKNSFDSIPQNDLNRINTELTDILLTKVEGMEKQIVNLCRGKIFIETNLLGDANKELSSPISEFNENKKLTGNILSVILKFIKPGNIFVKRTNIL
jgi:predicted nuclease with TOPRIM domain